MKVYLIWAIRPPCVVAAGTEARAADADRATLADVAAVRGADRHWHARRSRGTIDPAGLTGV